MVGRRRPSSSPGITRPTEFGQERDESVGFGGRLLGRSRDRWPRQQSGGPLAGRDLGEFGMPLRRWGKSQMRAARSMPLVKTDGRCRACRRAGAFGTRCR